MFVCKTRATGRFCVSKADADLNCAGIRDVGIVPTTCWIIRHWRDIALGISACVAVVSSARLANDLPVRSASRARRAGDDAPKLPEGSAFV